ncbi:MAG: hypothetical protein KC431_13835 [Myxococcales bacterium]|nr:hypothetical protein [Myxococcales bacterium]
MTRGTAARLALVLTLTALAACDPPGDPAAGKDGKPGDDKTAKEGKQAAGGEAVAGGEAGAAATGGTAAAPEEKTLGECLGNCEASDASEDDKATCRLRCKANFGEAGGKSETVGRYQGCFDGCETDKSATDKATCAKQCAGSVVAGSEPADKCGRGCLETLGSCLLPCDEKGEDDAATCRCQCESAGDKCLGAC